MNEDSPCRLLLTAALLLSLVTPASALGRPTVAAEYVVTSWSDEDGLFATQIFAMTQDRAGYLWLGTENGLFRFDGVRFTALDASHAALLPDTIVDTLCAARDGGLWLGFRVRGISRIRDGQLRTYGEREGFTGRRVNELIEDRDGTIWAATRSGLYRFGEERWEEIGRRHGLPGGAAYRLYEDSAGTLWVATSDGVFRRKYGRPWFEPFDTSLRYFPSFSEDRSGTIWITDPQHGFRSLMRNVSTDRRASAELPGGSGVELLHDTRGHLWLATAADGLWFVRSGPAVDRSIESIEVVGPESGLSRTTVVKSLFEDREGSIWVGTSGAHAGLYKFSPRRVAQVTDLRLVRALEAGSHGEIWVGTAADLTRFRGTERRSFGTKDGLPNARIRALTVDRSGTLWVATEAGVARVHDDRFRPIPLADGAWPRLISSIAVVSPDTLWISDRDSGLLRWNAGRLAPFDPSKEVSHSAIDSVAADSVGRVWLMMTGGGIGVFERGGAFRLLRPSDGSSLTVTAVYEDTAGAVWFGGGDRLTRFKDGQLASVSRNNGFPGNSILAITDDADGNLWVGTSSGIIRLARAEFDRASADPSHRPAYRLYDSSDGLAGMPVRHGFRNAVRGGDNRLWFVTGRGLAVIEPHQLTLARPLPRVQIEHFGADGRGFTAASGLVVPPRTTVLQIDYTAVTFTSPTKVTFRYRLEGYDEDWIDAGTRRQAFYMNLPPGEYRFRVIARSNEGIWNEQGDVLDFTIQPAFYETRWFYAACTSGIVLTVCACWRLRLRQVRKRFALVLSERVRLSREIHDTLLQSLVGVALQLDATSSTIESSSPGVKEQLGRIRRQVQQYIREARQSIWDLRSPTLEIDDLTTALRDAGARAIDGKPLQFDFVTTGAGRRCSSRVEEQVLRIGQEAIANAVRHAKARRIHVGLHYTEDSLRLKVADDGCGFDPSHLADETGKHCGLLIMQERAERVGGLFRLVTRPNVGTEIEAVVPLSFSGAA